MSSLDDAAVLAQHVRGELGRVAREEARSDVKRVVIVNQVNLRRLRGLGILDGIDLMQIVDQSRIRPGRVVKPAVDHGSSIGTHHADGFLSGVARRRRRLRQGPGPQTKMQKHEESH